MQAMDYPQAIIEIEKLIQNQRLKDAGLLCLSVLESLLYDIYAQIKSYAAATDMQRFPDGEGKVPANEEENQKLHLDRLADVFQEDGLLDRTAHVLGRTIKPLRRLDFQKLLEIRNRCSIPAYVPSADEIGFVYTGIKLIMEESGRREAQFMRNDSPRDQASIRSQPDEKPICRQCGEPLRKNWKICPVCETPVAALKCPQCGQMVKRHWTLCPQCNARLICSACNPQAPPAYRPEPVITDPITGMEFLWVAGGTFKMGDMFGDGLENETPVHDVELDDFYLGKYPVTQRQWKQVMGTNPSRFQKGDLYPVEQVSWSDVQAFIRKLTALNAENFVFRLPSEAEWEYAARSGGQKEKFAGGDMVGALAWYDENSGGSTHPVGRKMPNGLGFYDMSGNVWEWCRDGYDEMAYQSHECRNPVMPEGRREGAMRGGGWNLDSWSVRCTRRMGYPIDYFGPALGFRLVIYKI
jgi:formylglycine-generating enzyme required for sulfatase activity